MAIWNLGSINVDHVYSVPHLPGPGETLTASACAQGIGGKGANQSIAAALMGARVEHVGAVGPASDWVVAHLAAAGVGTRHIRQVAEATGHAIILVDERGENCITVHGGANRAQDEAAIAAALREAEAGDLFLMQNETSAQPVAARIAHAAGLRVLCSAAPFEVDAVRAVLDFVSVLMLNAVEAAQLERALGAGLAELPVEAIVVSRGAAGAEWIGSAGFTMPAFPVQPVDTTGAGDCLAGALAAGLDAGLSPEAAMRRATAAAAIKVTRPGAAAGMPHTAEVDAFLSSHRGNG